MKTMNPKRIHILLRALLLCLCAALLAGGAFAEETQVVNLGGWGMCRLRYQDTLPDGRILLAGYQEATDDPNPVPRLLCLNSDRTVSWDYLDTANPRKGFSHAAVLPDGTIGTVMENVFGNDQNTSVDLRFFTPDGEPTGKEISIPIPADGVMNVFATTKSGLDLLIRIEEGETLEFLPNRLYDWDGNEIGQVEGLDSPAISTDMMEEPDVLVMYGLTIYSDAQQSAIWKTDRENHLLWQTALPFLWTDAEFVSVQYFTATEDGGYLGIVTEGRHTSQELVNEYRTMLAKLDSEGKNLWVNGKVFEDIPDYLQAFGQYGGKYAAAFRNAGEWPNNLRLDNPMKFRWFDEDAADLGTVELELKPEDFDWLADYAEKLAGEKTFIEMECDTRLIPMEDGLWLAAEICVGTERNDENFGMVYMVDHDSYRDVLIKIPEP